MRVCLCARLSVRAYVCVYVYFTVCVLIVFLCFYRTGFHYFTFYTNTLASTLRSVNILSSSATFDFVITKFLTHMYVRFYYIRMCSIHTHARTHTHTHMIYFVATERHDSLYVVSENFYRMWHEYHWKMSTAVTKQQNFAAMLFFCWYGLFSSFFNVVVAYGLFYFIRLILSYFVFFVTLFIHLTYKERTFPFLLMLCCWFCGFFQ